MSDGWFIRGGEQWRANEVPAGRALWQRNHVTTEVLAGRTAAEVAEAIQQQLPAGQVLEMLRSYPSPKEGEVVLEVVVRSRDWQGIEGDAGKEAQAMEQVSSAFMRALLPPR